MKLTIGLTILMTLTTGCSKNLSLPVISELNQEAKELLSELGDMQGVPTEQSVRLGVQTSELIKVQKIQVTKVFKQDDSIMLVSRLSLASKQKKFLTNVIFSYKDGRSSFKKLVERMVILPKEGLMHKQKITLL